MKLDLTDLDPRFPAQRRPGAKATPRGGRTTERQKQYQRAYRARQKDRAQADPAYAEVLKARQRAWNMTYYTKMAAELESRGSEES